MSQPSLLFSQNPDSRQLVALLPGTAPFLCIEFNSKEMFVHKYHHYSPAEGSIFGLSLKKFGTASLAQLEAFVAEVKQVLDASVEEARQAEKNSCAGGRSCAQPEEQS